eukprot:TRINITY_DN12646_c0_g1_i1.p1 TRINITY_DN12646_c0_g1~~TRINITY_DN12646_c0_g1_i1.p1  ORF type:complete len:253 (+),score=39.91 TRINITY_DN12646_c0_g1_i1:67-825(+)
MTLSRAVIDNDVAELRRLLDLEFATDATDEDGRTALHWACATANVEMFNLLVGRTSSHLISAPDVNGWTPLTSAAAAGNASILKALLQSLSPTPEASVDSSVNHQTAQGRTALMYAVSKGHLECIQLLLAHGAAASIAVQDMFGATPLYRAAWNGDTRIIQTLLEALDTFARKSPPATFPGEVASAAAAPSDEDAHRRRCALVLNLADREGNTALHCAGAANHEDAGKLLIRAGADRDAVNKKGEHFYDVKL